MAEVFLRISEDSALVIVAFPPGDTRSVFISFPKLDLTAQKASKPPTKSERFAPVDLGSAPRVTEVILADPQHSPGKKDTPPGRDEIDNRRRSVDQAPPEDNFPTLRVKDK